MPVKSRKIVVSPPSSPLSSASPVKTDAPIFRVASDPSPVAVTPSGEREGSEPSRKRSKKTINSFSVFKSAFEVPGQMASSSKVSRVSNRATVPGKSSRSAVVPVNPRSLQSSALGIAHKGSARDVIVLDDSDIEEDVVMKKRPRTVAFTRQVSAEVISSDERVVPVKGKAQLTSIVRDKKSTNQSLDDTQRASFEQEAMWCDEYAPTSTVDLAPSKTRVQSVRNWLEEALYGRPNSVDGDIPFSKQARDRVRKYRRILVLSGPAGVGKTTTLKVVAKELNVEVVEWEEGAEEWSMAGQIDRESMNSKFVGFLSRNAYNPLSLTNGSLGPSASQLDTSSPVSVPTTQPRVLLITSLPNLSHLPTRQTFHQALLDYTKSFISTSCPLVIIVPDAGSSGVAEESWIGGDSGGEAAWDLRTVMGKDLMVNPAVRIVEFLPMAPTFLVKALKRISALAFPDAKSRPSQESIHLIAHTANGDLRSAINSLQFLSRSGDAGNGLTASRAREPGAKLTGKGSRGGKGGKLKASEEVGNLLNAVARREQSLGLFHALGKVLYNKRIGDAGEDGAVDPVVLKAEEEYMAEHALPPHLAHYSRRRYENDLDLLIASVPVDTATFTLWLHQNLPPFCAQIEQVDEAYEDICRADLMRADDDIWQRSPQAIAYAFHVAVRGSLNGLPHPVPRNHQKLTKPQFFEYLRVKRERQDSVMAAAKWLSRPTTMRRSPATTVQEEDEAYRHWGGQLSQSILATEFMPCFRILKRAGAQIPFAVIPDGDEAFMSFGDDEFKLEILAENEGVPDDDLSEDEFKALARTNHSLHKTGARNGILSDEVELNHNQPFTWLAEDDIEDD